MILTWPPKVSFCSYNNSCRCGIRGCLRWALHKSTAVTPSNATLLVLNHQDVIGKKAIISLFNNLPFGLDFRVTYSIEYLKKQLLLKISKGEEFLEVSFSFYIWSSVLGQRWYNTVVHSIYSIFSAVMKWRSPKSADFGESPINLRNNSDFIFIQQSTREEHVLLNLEMSSACRAVVSARLGEQALLHKEGVSNCPHTQV